MLEEKWRSKQEAEKVTEEGDFEGMQLVRRKPDDYRHAAKQDCAQYHEKNRPWNIAFRDGRFKHHGIYSSKRAPIIRGSGSMRTPNFSLTDLATRLASASNCCPVALP